MDRSTRDPEFYIYGNFYKHYVAQKLFCPLSYEIKKEVDNSNSAATIMEGKQWAVIQHESERVTVQNDNLAHFERTSIVSKSQRTTEWSG